jgi:hypothetical protein
MLRVENNGGVIEVNLNHVDLVYRLMRGGARAMHKDL